MHPIDLTMQIEVGKREPVVRLDRKARTPAKGTVRYSTSLERYIQEPRVRRCCPHQRCGRYQRYQGQDIKDIKAQRAVLCCFAGGGWSARAVPSPRFRSPASLALDTDNGISLSLRCSGRPSSRSQSPGPPTPVLGVGIANAPSNCATHKGIFGAISDQIEWILTFLSNV